MKGASGYLNSTIKQLSTIYSGILTPLATTLAVCQGWNFGGWKDRTIDRNYNPEQSKVLHQREVLLSESTKKAPVGSQE